MTAPSGMDALTGLWLIAGGDVEALKDITLTGEDPVLPSIFRVGTAAQATIGAASLAAAEVWRVRTGRRQQVSLSMRDAAVSFRSELYTHVVGKPVRSIGPMFRGTTRPVITVGFRCIASTRICAPVSSRFWAVTITRPK